MRQGCEYILGLKVRNPEFHHSLIKSESVFDKIVARLDICSAKYKGCDRCPDIIRCDNRFNGICKKAQSVSPPFAFVW